MLTIILTGALLFALTARLTVKKQLQNSQAYLWLLVSILVMFFGAILPTNFIRKLAILIGIQYPPTFFVLLGFIFLIVIILWQSTMLTKHERQITKLAQEVALMNHELHRDS